VTTVPTLIAAIVEGFKDDDIFGFESELEMLVGVQGVEGRSGYIGGSGWR
jgi:hypothetical protein